jgi:ABC-2 type transport system ATP-binding protein
MIKISGLTKYYGNYLAVDHIDLDIYEGEIFGLLGPNGAGKTTTLLMLTTVIKPTEGSAIIMGYDIRREPEKVREIIGMAFQEPKLYWVNTPWEILVWHAKVCGYKGKEAKEIVREVLDKLDMWDARNKRAFQLSGGMKKRVEIAKLFIQRPKVAIFDEPTSQIDVSGKHKIWGMIRELRSEGSTIILATNELYEADILSDRVGIIHKGKIAALGSPSALKDMIPGGDVLEIKVDRLVPEEIRSELEAIPEVSRVSESDGTIRLYLNRAEEILPSVVQLLVSKEIRVRSVNMREPTLNDVFLHFTGMTITEAEGRGDEWI